MRRFPARDQGIPRYAARRITLSISRRGRGETRRPYASYVTNAITRATAMEISGHLPANATSRMRNWVPCSSENLITQYSPRGC